MLKKTTLILPEKNDFVIAAVSDFLLSQDIVSVETYETKEKQNEIVFICLQESNIELTVKKLKEFLALLGIEGYSVKTENMEEKNWVEEFKKFFNPFDMNKYYRIIPSWEKDNSYAYSETAKNIIVEPGQAFGTGLHGTTSVCSEFIKEYAEQNKNFTFLDAGTGSGILSVIAAKEKASKIVAFDIDPLCSEMYTKHFKINDLIPEETMFFIGTVNCLKEEKYSLVVANILEKIIREIIDSLIEFTGDKLVLSGILEKNCYDFEKFIEKKGVRVVEKRVKGEWVGLLCEVENAD